jgi:hypothetical protein
MRQVLIILLLTILNITQKVCGGGPFHDIHTELKCSYPSSGSYSPEPPSSDRPIIVVDGSRFVKSFPSSSTPQTIVDGENLYEIKEKFIPSREKLIAKADNTDNTEKEETQTKKNDVFDVVNENEADVKNGTGSNSGAGTTSETKSSNITKAEDLDGPMVDMKPPDHLIETTPKPVNNESESSDDKNRTILGGVTSSNLESTAQPSSLNEGTFPGMNPSNDEIFQNVAQTSTLSYDEPPVYDDPYDIHEKSQQKTVAKSEDLEKDDSRVKNETADVLIDTANLHTNEMPDSANNGVAVEGSGSNKTSFNDGNEGPIVELSPPDIMFEENGVKHNETEISPDGGGGQPNQGAGGGQSNGGIPLTPVSEDVANENNVDVMKPPPSDSLETFYDDATESATVTVAPGLEQNSTVPGTMPMIEATETSSTKKGKSYK